MDASARRCPEMLELVSTSSAGQERATRVVAGYGCMAVGLIGRDDERGPWV
jgi:hypothetical protein